MRYPSRLSRDLPISCTSASYNHQSYFVTEALLRSFATRFSRHCFFLVFDIVSRAGNGSKCVGVDGVQLQRVQRIRLRFDETYLQNYLPPIEVVGPLSQNINETLYTFTLDARCVKPAAGFWRRKLAVVDTTSAVQSVEVRSSPFYPRRSKICRSIAVRELVHHAETLEMRHSRVR